MSALYRVSWSANSNLALFSDAPVTRAGCIFEDDSSATQLFLRRLDRRPMGDCLAILGGYLVVSDRFRELVVASECVRWVPIEKAPDGLAFDHTLWLAWPTKEFDILDRSKSRYDMFPGTNVIGHITTYVVTAKLIPKCALFKANRKWFVQASVKDAILTDGLSGFDFEEVGLA
jgi:hypothetical protein